MGREYVVKTWVRHEPGDPSVIPDHMVDDMPGYSGEQIGNRNAKSNGNTKARGVVAGWLANGDADIAGAADPADEIKGNPLTLVDPAYKVLIDYPAKVSQLDKALEAKQITQGQYNQALAILGNKLEKAESKLLALAASEEQEEHQEPEPLPVYEEDLIAPYRPTEEEKHQALKNFENSLI